MDRGGAPDRKLLRVLTCGSVDDGKSTLMGRLLHACGRVPDDQLAALERDSKAHGTVPGGLDFALLFDGLQAEREQGITIDVAYRYFATAKRRFVAVDAPGHVQYTRNMATGATQADLAVVLVDATKGVLEQTRRHSKILALMDLRPVILAVNKMDLTGYGEPAFRAIEAAYASLARELGLSLLAAIPVAAAHGDNVAAPGDAMPWYRGPTLLAALEAFEPSPAAAAKPFRMPVQSVVRPDATFRGFAGRVSAGRIATGDEIAVLPGGAKTRIKRIVTMNGDLAEASAGRSVTLELEDQIDIGRGHVLAQAPLPDTGDRFVANLIWFADAPMLPGRRYLMKLGAQSAVASVTAIKHKIDVASFAKNAAVRLETNEIASCDVATETPVVFEPFAEGAATGAFILIDRVSDETVGAGTIEHALRRGSTVFWSKGTVERADRIAAKGHLPATLWLTGLSGSGKSTLAHALDRRLAAMGCHTFVLDGDNLRHGINADLGFTDADRVENIRRVAHVARLMNDAGILAIAALISPFRRERQAARETMAPGEFFEIFVDAPLAECERRDAKGLYKRARAGQIPNFTGIGAPYEAPENPDLHLDTAARSVEDSVERVVALLRARAILPPGRS